MNQLPKDYYQKNIPVPVPAVIPEPEPLLTFVAPLPDDTPATLSQSGVWFGTIPPSSPSIGWTWLNSVNNGLYVFTNPGVWTQVGTNW